MRIRSSFHDYYDGALGHGADPALLYLRRASVAVTPVKPQAAPMWGDPEPVEGLPEGFLGANTVQAFGHPYRLVSVPMYLALAGRWQVVWSLRLFQTSNPETEVPRTAAVAQSAEDARAWVISVLTTHSPDLLKDRRVRKLCDKFDQIQADVERQADMALTFNRVQRSPLVVVAPSEELRRLEAERDKFRRAELMNALVPPDSLTGRQGWSNRMPYMAFVDLPLRWLDIQKSTDAYGMFQRLSQFLGGVLAQPERPMAVLSDQSLLAKHGFDARYGFRHRP